MSVIVQGMKMPKNCMVCPFGLTGECLVVMRNVAIPLGSKTMRTNWCPLKPLPETHGDLIDRDDVPRFGGRKGLIHSVDLDAMPVIVEAEGEDG